MNDRIEFKPSAADAVRALPAKAQGQVIKKIERLAQDPRPRQSKKLEGTDSLRRIRSGVYRVVYRVEDDRLIVLVVRVAHRRDVYRGL